MTNQNKMDDKFKKTMQKILAAFIITLAVIVVGAFIYITYVRLRQRILPIRHCSLRRRYILSRKKS